MNSTPERSALLKLFLPALLSALGWISAMLIDSLNPQLWPSPWIRICWYLLAYLPVGLPVIQSAIRHARKGTIFSEFSLMSLATLGAFAIKEYPEAVAVMLFYTVGENLQSLAVKRARGSIRQLMDQRPDIVTQVEEHGTRQVPARSLGPGDRFLAKPGERLALDGRLLSDHGRFDTQSLTGESRPLVSRLGDPVLAGMIALRAPVEIEVTADYTHSRLSQILELTEQASQQKAPTEQFIRRFARIYTPAVVLAALAICLLPYFWSDPYIFRDWLYRALVFLVISCPCALVISIPLSYVGGLGAASRQGILFKGSSYLEALSRVKHIVWDKTGTLTESGFSVETIHLDGDRDPDLYLPMVKALETNSQHPLAKAIVQELADLSTDSVAIENPMEWEGLGIEGLVNGQRLILGSFRWLDQASIAYPETHRHTSQTTVAMAYGGTYIGYIRFGDKIRIQAKEVIAQLRDRGIESSLLSGDQEPVVESLATKLGIRRYQGNLLPDEKVQWMKEIKEKEGLTAFVGDGVNDGPVLAWSDLGIAMGKGSDLAIEAADLVIDDDRLEKITVAMKISRRTQQIVWQNLWLAFGVKALVLILGAYGQATMWEAVFADVGVALLAVANALRVQQKNP